MVRLRDLYGIFFKMGIFTFGGGYAMLPILKDETVEKRRWITEEELLNYYSIGQCTPGIIAVNAASFIGYKLRGFWGMIWATLVAMLLRQYMDNQYEQWAFDGIRVSVIALIIDTVAGMWKKGICRIRDYVVFGLAAILLLFFNLSAVAIVILAAAGSFIPNFKRQK